MGMSIDEAFYCLSNDKYACSKCRHLYSKHNCREEAVNVAIDTMRKYQKIEQVANDYKRYYGSGIRMTEAYWLERIKEVLEDGDDD